MPSLAKGRSGKSPSPRSGQGREAQEGRSRAVNGAKNGKNGHGTGIRVSSKTAVLKKAAPTAAGKAGKRVYFFGGGKAEGTKEMKNLLGGKGANLAEMTNIGLPVPPGFTITTEVCTEFYAQRQEAARRPRRRDARRDRRAWRRSWARSSATPTNPLLVSVRSGARASMPGMMDTILNLGLNDDTVEGLAAKSGNERFAYDSYRRFIADVRRRRAGHEARDEGRPRSVRRDPREEEAGRGVKLDTELTGRRAQGTGRGVQGRDQERVGRRVPRGSRTSSSGAPSRPSSVVEERPRHHLPPHQQHPGGVGHGRQRPGDGLRQHGRRLARTGVSFTRDPATGENMFYGEYLINAQGEDVVAGIRTPEPIDGARQGSCPTAYKQLIEIRKKLEKHYNDMQDIEFTVENGKLYMLQIPQRQAHRLRRRAHRRRDGRREADHEGGGAAAASSRRPSTSCCTRLRPGEEGGHRRGPAARQGPPRRPRRGHRQGRVLADEAEALAAQGRDQPSSWCATRPARRTSAA